MYASLWVRESDLTNPLVQLARRFSPEVEQANHSVVFSIAPLRKLIGSPHQIASEICRAGYELKLQASLAIASNPDAAMLLARHIKGVTLITPGQEHLKLAQVPLAGLFEYDAVKLDPGMLEILLRWGVKTCEDLVALPEKGITERLGPAGVYLRNLAAGNVHRPLRLNAEETSYEVKVQLEHSLQLLEPLLFLLSRAAGELCHRLRSQSRAAREIELVCDMDARVADDAIADQPTETLKTGYTHGTYKCKLEFPVPLDDPRTILKLLQLHLERHPPGAPVNAFGLKVEPVEPRCIQGGIFLPPTPRPDKLQVTLARIAGMVGTENVGTPVLCNTHRPDAFTSNVMPEQAKASVPLQLTETQTKPEMLRLAMRLFRPALHAHVQVVQLTPRNVFATGVRGHVLRYAGPWKTAGEWWTDTAWSREEWDVALDDGALYRIYQESTNHEWFVHGIYD